MFFNKSYFFSISFFLILILDLNALTIQAQSGYVGESIYLTGPSVPGTIGGAAWTCDNNSVSVSGNHYGATATINSYFSGTATVTCQYVYSYYVGTKIYYSSTQYAHYYLSCKASKVTLNKREVDLSIGQEVELSYTNSSGVDLPFVLWTTSDSKVANFDGYNKVSGEKKVTITALKSGQCVITCEGYTGYDAPTCVINVKYIPPTSISINPSSTSVVVGKSKSLYYKLAPEGASATVGWTSSNESIVKVSSAGKITGIAEGNATITVTTEEGLSANCTVNVVSAPKSVSLLNSADVVQGYTIQLNPTLTPVNSETTYKWKSDDTTIATVASNGKVTGKNIGTATITVTTENGLTATCKVIVRNAPQGADYRNARIRVKAIKDLVTETLKYIDK